MAHPTHHYGPWELFASLLANGLLALGHDVTLYGTHGFSSSAILPVYEWYDATSTYVAISDADRHPRLHYAATIHHGIDVEASPSTRCGRTDPRVAT